MDITKPFENVPQPRLAMAMLSAWALVGFVIYAAAPHPDNEHRVTIEGEVKDVRTPEVLGQLVLDFALVEYANRFRVQADVFAGPMQSRVPEALQPGAKVVLQLPASSLPHPPKQAPYRVPTADVDAIAVGGQALLTLEASNGAQQRADRGLLTSLPVFVLIALYLTWVLWKRRPS